MLTLRPHEILRIEFNKIIEDGKRQEQIDEANVGEYDLVVKMHQYFRDSILPKIQTDEWIYSAAERFALEFATDCFHYMQIGYKEVYEAQNKIIQIKQQVINLLEKANNAGYVQKSEQISLIKASDFIFFIDLDKADSDFRLEASELNKKAKDQEHIHLKVTLRAIRDLYETILPRIMYVAGRVFIVDLGLRRKSSDNELSSISSYISWYETYVGSDHAFYPVLGKLIDFYKIARNVGSHHHGLIWDAANNTVTLEDRKSTINVHVNEFQQRYRYLVYLCELGVRGILAAFCKQDQGKASNRIFLEYDKTFPIDFPFDEEVKILLYPVVEN